MATGSLPGTFRFKGFLRVVSILVTFLFFGRLSLTSQVYATAWYTVVDGGILSGSEINNPDVPDPPTAPYEPETIQNPGSGDGNPSVGALVSGGEQSVEVSGDVPDAFIKNISTAFNLGRLDVAGVASGVSDAIATADCPSPSLDPGKFYNASASCINSMAGYNLTSGGLAVVIVNDATSPINVMPELKSSDSKERLLIITNSQVAYLNNTNAQDREISILSTNSSASTIRGYLEGPLVSSSNVVLSQDAGNSPGAVITHNPTYLLELTNIGRNDLLEIKGLLGSKVSWRYE